MNQLDFTDKIVVITGGVRGIGKEIANLFLSNNATVVVADRDKDSFDQENDIDYQYLDLTSEEICHNLINYLRERYGDIHTLVNNARGGTRA